MRRLNNSFTGGHDFANEISSKDELDYLIDMLAELKAMAAKAEASTLVRLLDVAHYEAKVQLRLRQQ